jgi:DNA-binding response OmpR family regulator
VSNVPIIYVSARAGEMDQVMAIENGGDDYLTKPFHLDVVLAKMKSLLRRVYGEYAPQTAPADVTDVSGLMIDRARFEAAYGGRSVSLSKTELQLLDALAQAAGRVVRRETLLETIWDDTKFVDDNTLTVNITRLRRKLEELGLAGCIETVRGTGYKLNVSWENGADAGREVPEGGSGRFSDGGGRQDAGMGRRKPFSGYGGRDAGKDGPIW